MQASDFSARKKYRTYRAYPFAFAPPRYYRTGANPNWHAPVAAGAAAKPLRNRRGLRPLDGVQQQVILQ